MLNSENTDQIEEMITHDLYKNIESYAKEHAETSWEYYNSLHSNKMQKTKDDYFYQCLKGKLAEYNLFFHLKREGFCTTEPDLKIYKKSKSYDADIIILGKESELFSEENRLHLHVKSISIETFDRFKTSFLLDIKDPLVKDQKNESFKKHFFVALHESRDNFLVYENIKRVAVHNVNYIYEPHLPHKAKVTID